MLLTLSIPLVSSADTAEEKNINIQDYVNKMQPGWNLGNTFDAVGADETAWGNPRVTQQLIKSIADQGFNSIRVPITFDQRMEQGPEYTINEDFLTRIDQVIEWSLAENMYVMINIHHDSWIWLEAGMQQNHDESVARYNAIWEQLSERYKDISTKVMFESINEPRFVGTEEEKQQYLDELNSSFYDIVRNSGGLNDVRPLVLPTLDTGSEDHKIDALYSFITELDDPNIISTVHYYGFWPFSVNIAGFTTFNEETKNDIITTFDRVHNKFTANGIPVVIGEFGLLGFDTDINAVQQGEKLKFFEFLTHYAKEKQLTHMLWDNGQHFGRTTYQWSDSDLFEVMKTGWTTRSGSAESDSIFINQNDAITDVTVKLTLNGNTFASLKLQDEELVAGQDYTINNDELVLKSSLLEQLLDGDKLGTNAVVSVKFDKGMDWKLNIISYDAVELASTQGAVSDFAIPTTFNGDKLATMEAYYTDGSFAGPQNWTSFKEFAYTFKPSYEANEIIIRDNFFNETRDGILKLKLHFWSGNVLDYTLIKNGTSVVGLVAHNEVGNVAFEDVPSAHWANPSVTILAERGIVQGEQAGLFNPNGTVTRAAFTQMLIQALGLVDEAAVSSFSDVSSDAWYATAVASAEKLAIVTGNSDGTFGANASITRQDAAVMLNRALAAAGITLSNVANSTQFTDQASISEHAQAAVAAVHHAGIITGKSDGSFDPHGNATRAEAATMIFRLVVQAETK